ncbi:MAG TPA: zinc ribbon domain-containing protein [Nitrososphaeraceae archaeon]
MKIFNGRAATEDYMSTHTLTFSTPEMTLKKFALWLGESITLKGYDKQVPRLISYLKDTENENVSSFLPDVDETFKPSGAVSDMFKDSTSQNYNNEKKLTINQIVCPECKNILKTTSKFCPKCGTKQ